MKTTIIPAKPIFNIPLPRRVVAYCHVSTNQEIQHPEPIGLTLRSADIIHRGEKQNEVYYYNGSEMYDYLAKHMRDRNAIYRITDNEVR